jgi:hypothetical protein
MEEGGGVNLYGFVGNAPNNRIDPQGLYDFIVSGTGAAIISLPGQDADYIRDVGRLLLNNPNAESIGSSASFGGYLASLGRSSWWDAVLNGNDVADAIIKNNDLLDRGMGHSQGVRIALEGVFRASLKANVDCKKELRILILAPKVEPAYIDKVHQKIVKNQPLWTVKFMIVYAEDDRLVPHGGMTPWSGKYEPTGYAFRHYRLLSIVGGHSSVHHTGQNVSEEGDVWLTQGIPKIPRGQAAALEARIREFLEGQ